MIGFVLRSSLTQMKRSVTDSIESSISTVVIPLSLLLLLFSPPTLLLLSSSGSFTVSNHLSGRAASQGFDRTERLNAGGGMDGRRERVKHK